MANKRDSAFTHAAVLPHHPIRVGRLCMVSWQVSWLGIIVLYVLPIPYKQRNSGSSQRTPPYSGGTAPEFHRTSLLSWLDLSSCPAAPSNTYSIMACFYPITVSCFGNCVMTSTPVSVTSTLSSIRTPPTPGT